MNSLVVDAWELRTQCCAFLVNFSQAHSPLPTSGVQGQSWRNLGFIQSLSVCSVTILSQMVVTGELETTSDESEPDNTESNQCLCPYCGCNYAHNTTGCEHLLCTLEFVESNNELVVATDHPLATIYGIDVPRVVAGRFMHYLRDQARMAGACSWVTVSPQGVCTSDLLAERGSRGSVISIKHAHEDAMSFREWTYYFSAAPSESMKQFVSFVRKNYCDSLGGDEDSVVPFSRIHLLPSITTLELADLVGHWVMLTGLPDDLPIFFFSVTAPTSNKPTMLINHSANMVNRMRCWSSTPTCVCLTSLQHLPPPAIFLN